MAAPRKLDLYRWIHGDPGFFRTKADEIVLLEDEDVVRFCWLDAVALPDDEGPWHLGADVGLAHGGTLRAIWLTRDTRKHRGVTLFADIEPRIPYRGLIVGLLRAQMNAFLASSDRPGVPTPHASWEPTPTPAPP